MLHHACSQQCLFWKILRFLYTGRGLAQPPIFIAGEIPFILKYFDEYLFRVNSYAHAGRQEKSTVITNHKDFGIYKNTNSPSFPSPRPIFCESLCVSACFTFFSGPWTTLMCKMLQIAPHSLTYLNLLKHYLLTQLFRTQATVDDTPSPNKPSPSK